MSTSEPFEDSKDKLGSSRGCLWTLYDYDKHLESLREYAKTECEYMVFGYEVCPKTGRPHLQGYHHWKNQRSIGRFSRKYNNCQVKSPNGSPEQNRMYCLKIRPEDKVPNEKWEEFGSMPRQGERTDWKQAYNQVKEGQPLENIIEAQPQLIPCINHLEKLKCRFLKPLHREVEVIVLWGDAGTGKSRWAYDHYPDIYSKPPSKWWDGYTGQKTILLDDYYGYLPYSELLNVLDRYPYHAEVKGGYVWAQWTTVIITSNKKPSRWYSVGLTPALKRRIKMIRHVIKDASNNTVWENDTLENGCD